MGPINIDSYFNTDANKRFFFPGKVIWGQKTKDLLADQVPKNKSVLIIVDHFFRSDDYILKLQSKWAAQLIDTVYVTEEPRTQSIEHHISKLKNPPDYVVAIGGGSSQDFAKCIIANYYFGTFYNAGYADLREPNLSHKINYIALPTTAGTGAESSRYYVAYNSETKAKVMGRSWSLIADLILIDPYFLKNAPKPLLVSCAFDTFVHYFESFICKYERSVIGDMYSLNGIGQIMNSLRQALNGDGDRDECLTNLLLASTFGGIAISNIRTGHIHEAAGSLLEHTNLSHAETLLVFFRQAVLYYGENIKDRESLLIPQLNILNFKFNHIIDLVNWWEDAFKEVGLWDGIHNEVRKISANEVRIKKAIYDRVFEDKVWVSKESPKHLSSTDVTHFIENSLHQFGLGS